LSGADSETIIRSRDTDAHAKNYSIMIRGNGVSLALIYDVMCGDVWENVNVFIVKNVSTWTRA
jgi:hypothetical protein